MIESNKQETINPLFKAGLELQNTMEENKWQFCFIGGLSVLRWGEIRMTQDIDLCLLCGFGNEGKYSKALLRSYRSRISDAYNFALANRVLLLYASNDVSVDISLSGLQFEEQMIKGATFFSFHPDCTLMTCSAEDLIILKAFADRTKDWMDVEGIIVRQGKNLNIDFIIEQLSPLCKEKGTTNIINKLQTLFKNLC